MNFTERVLLVVSEISKGEVLSYRQVATRAGNPNAARAVGMIMSKNHDPSIPCHRVIGSDGKLHGYNHKRGIREKYERLLAEGVPKKLLKFQ